MTTKLYVMDNSEGYVKVGISVDPYKRMKSLQTGNPHRLTLIKTYPFETRKDALQFEKKCHHFLSRFDAIGEWFNTSAEVVVGAIDVLITGGDVDYSREETLKEYNQILADIETNKTVGELISASMRKLRAELDANFKALTINVNEYTILRDRLEILSTILGIPKDSNPT